MHEFGFTSIHGFVWGCALSVFHRVVKLSSPTADAIIYGVVGAISSRYLLPDRRASLPANKPMTSAQVRLLAFFLGWGFSVGILICERGNNFYPFGIYCCFLAIFHYSEFLITSFINPEELALSSFLLDHSKEYGIAALASVVEYFIESFLCPEMKQFYVITTIGVTICVLGEIVRKGAMLTASRNFTHLVRDKKVEGHVLITHGLYNICRHPSYAGWFWWSVGTQVILLNPICLLGYAFASQRFFRGRIYYEEACLISFFSDYPEYQKRVPRTGVPFVKGFVDFTSQ